MYKSLRASSSSSKNIVIGPAGDRVAEQNASDGRTDGGNMLASKQRTCM